MDLEMTGLDPARHVIVEIATLVTDDELTVVAEGPDLVVHQPPAAMAAMDDVVRDMHGRSGLTDIPWSAAFISWDIESAGVPRDLFCPDQRHTIYVERIVERAKKPGAVFIPHAPDGYAPRVGDLICASRENSGTTLQNLNRGAGHCDIVVEVKPGWAAAIGGNVADSVSRSVFPLDGGGFLSPISARPVFTVIENRLR